MISFIFLGSKAIDGEIKPRELSVIDPVGKYQTKHSSFHRTIRFFSTGAIAISLYIIACWIPQVRRK